MEKQIKKLVEWLIILLSVAILVFCVTTTVSGQNGIQDREKEQYYKERETALLEDTRALLNEMGFRDSGVTLTRITDGAGKREYIFTIHHYRLDGMDEPERKEAIGKLTENISELAADFRPASLEDEIAFDYKYLIL